MKQTNKGYCGKCTVCCQNYPTTPITAYDNYLYLTTTLEFIEVLQNKPNGDCIYLSRNKGCLIYDTRPFLCRKYDCRGAIEQEFASRLIKKAAKKARKRALRLEKNNEY